jgi:hypothetical protein
MILGMEDKVGSFFNLGDDSGNITGRGKKSARDLSPFKQMDRSALELKIEDVENSEDEESPDPLKRGKNKGKGKYGEDDMSPKTKAKFEAEKLLLESKEGTNDATSRPDGDVTRNKNGDLFGIDSKRVNWADKDS